MQGRHHRNSNGGRGYNSSSNNYRSFNRSVGSVSFNRSGGPYLPPPPRRKEEILMEAGRLAAEYLVYKGLLPPNSLPPKGISSKFDNFKAQERDFVPPDGRNFNSDAGPGRRRYTDDYGDGRMGLRNHFRGKRERRVDPYNCSRDYGSDWGRENGRWVERERERERNREYDNDDDMEEGEDFPPAAYHARDRRRSGLNHFPSRSEVTGESGSENHDVAEDTGSKASSSSTKKEVRSDADGDLNRSMADNIKATNSETGDEVKSDLKKESQVEEEEESGAHAYAHTHACGAADEGDNEGRDDLVKLCDFARVPTKPRSSLTQRSPKLDEGIPTETSNFVEGSPVVETKITSSEDDAGGSLNDSCISPTNKVGELPQDVQSVDRKPEACQNPPDFKFSKSKPIEEEEEEVEEVEVEEIQIEEEDMLKSEGVKRKRDSSPDDEFSRVHNLRLKQSNPAMEKSAMDAQIVMPATSIESLVIAEQLVASVEVDREKRAQDDCFPGNEPELDVKLEEEKQLLPTSFKICDLNLMEGPEITEIPDDSAPDTIQTSVSSLDAGKVLSMDFGLSIGNNNNEIDEYNQLSSDDKVVQVIDLGDDSPIHSSSCDPLKPKDETIYPNLDSFLNQTEHADLPRIQDGYSLAISEFLGSDISRCPSVPSDLNNLESGMSLHDTEGVPNDDDSIYVSLGEIPIGFMEVWDQPPQVYGKFF